MDAKAYFLKVRGDVAYIMTKFPCISGGSLWSLLSLNKYFLECIEGRRARHLLESIQDLSALIIQAAAGNIDVADKNANQDFLPLPFAPCN